MLGMLGRGQYIVRLSDVLVEKEYFEYLKNRAEALYTIRAEIETLSTSKCTETHCININATEFKEKVLAIIDKYIKSEDKNDHIY